MALIKPVRGISPSFGADCWFAENSTIVGDVEMGANCTVWFNAVIRGDVNSIRIGDNSNVQDGAIIHCTYQRCGTIIGNHCSIAHRAIVHGCTIQDNVLIGMGAIVMDGAIVGEGSIVAAGAIVTQGTIIPPRTIYAGSPAVFLKNVTDEYRAAMLKTSNNYIMYAGWFKEEEQSLKED